MFISHFSHGDSELNATLKWFWGIESVETVQPSMSRNDKLALDSVDKSLMYTNNSYTVSVPWKDSKRQLPNNYGMALNRLKNTEKRLRKDQHVGEVYSETIEKYVQKVYIRKVPDADSVVFTTSYSMHRQNMVICA